MNGMNSGKPSVVATTAILSQAGGTPPEGAETTWGLAECFGTVPSVLDDRLERPAPDRRRHDGEGDEIVHARRKRRETVNPLVPGSSPGGPTKRDRFAAARNFAYAKSPAK